MDKLRMESPDMTAQNIDRMGITQTAALAAQRPTAELL